MDDDTERAKESTGGTPPETCSYNNPWMYNGKCFESDDIGELYGFVYCITNLRNGRKYIGRKYFWQFRKPRNKNRRVKSESDWKNYYGSSDHLKEDIAAIGRENFRREILSVHPTKGFVNYEETRQLFTNNVLTEALDNGEPAYYNNNVLSRYFRKDYFNGTIHDR